MNHRTLFFFIGRLGSGKTFIAKEYEKELRGKGLKTSFIEVSSIMASFIGKDATREQKQALKEKFKENPRFLIDRLFNDIKNASAENVIISGLREYWIFEELQKKYDSFVIIVTAPDELRRKRRNYSEEEFKLAEEGDDKIGLGELIKKVSPIAVFKENVFENSL